MLRRYFLLLAANLNARPQESHQATGVKVGEVTENAAKVWMRYTRDAARNSTGTLRRGDPQPMPADVSTNSFEGAVPGGEGRVRIRWSTDPSFSNRKSTKWVTVFAATDFSHQFDLDGLQPDTRYYYSAETSRSGQASHEPLHGTFRTPPNSKQEVDINFAVITCQAYRHTDHPGGYRIYSALSKLNAHFVVATGDNVYLDNEDPRATTPALVRYHWQRMYSLPLLASFYRTVACYWEKDDHDTYLNDAWPGKKPEKMAPLTFDEGCRLFREQCPVGPKPYRTFRWGKGVQIWLPEVREFRSPNRDPDGPGKTILGLEQKRWLKESILASDADWRLIISPTAIVGPDRPNKSDSHANEGFAHEGNELRQWIAQHARHNLFIACGDRHWQYHSKDPETGIEEFGCGPVSDEHAEGSPGLIPGFHRFHRQKGGFLSVSVKSGSGQPSITFRHHDVDGGVVHEHTAHRVSEKV